MELSKVLIPNSNNLNINKTYNEPLSSTEKFIKNNNSLLSLDQKQFIIGGKWDIHHTDESELHKNQDYSNKSNMEKKTSTQPKLFNTQSKSKSNSKGKELSNTQIKEQSSKNHQQQAGKDNPPPMNIENIICKGKDLDSQLDKDELIKDDQTLEELLSENTGIPGVPSIEEVYDMDLPQLEEYEKKLAGSESEEVQQVLNFIKYEIRERKIIIDVYSFLTETSAEDFLKQIEEDVIFNKNKMKKSIDFNFERGNLKRSKTSLHDNSADSLNKEDQSTLINTSTKLVGITKGFYHMNTQENQNYSRENKNPIYKDSVYSLSKDEKDEEFINELPDLSDDFQIDFNNNYEEIAFIPDDENNKVDEKFNEVLFKKKGIQSNYANSKFKSKIKNNSEGISNPDDNSIYNSNKKYMGDNQFDDFKRNRIDERLEEYGQRQDKIEGNENNSKKLTIYDEINPEVKNEFYNSKIKNNTEKSKEFEYKNLNNRKTYDYKRASPAEKGINNDNLWESNSKSNSQRNRNSRYEMKTTIEETKNNAYSINEHLIDNNNKETNKREKKLSDMFTDKLKKIEDTKSKVDQNIITIINQAQLEESKNNPKNEKKASEVQPKSSAITNKFELTAEKSYLQFKTDGCKGLSNPSYYQQNTQENPIIKNTYNFNSIFQVNVGGEDIVHLLNNTNNNLNNANDSFTGGNAISSQIKEEENTNEQTSSKLISGNGININNSNLSFNKLNKMSKSYFPKINNDKKNNKNNEAEDDINTCKGLIKNIKNLPNRNKTGIDSVNIQNVNKINNNNNNFPVDQNSSDSKVIYCPKEIIDKIKLEENGNKEIIQAQNSKGIFKEEISIDEDKLTIIGNDNFNQTSQNTNQNLGKAVSNTTEESDKMIIPVNSNFNRNTKVGDFNDTANKKQKLLTNKQSELLQTKELLDKEYSNNYKNTTFEDNIIRTATEQEIKDFIIDSEDESIIYYSQNHNIIKRNLDNINENDENIKKQELQVDKLYSNFVR